MTAYVWALVCMWVVEALAVGYVMGRRGFEAYSWTFLGLIFGPISLVLAASYYFKPPAHAPLLMRVGHPRVGASVERDVLVGVDGSNGSIAALDAAVRIFGPSAGRVTLARVVPFDATVEAERRATAQLAAVAAAHGELDPSTVVLRGEPASALRHHIAASGYDVLVVGTRGEGRASAPLGSVATRLSRGAGVPVMLVDAAGADRDEVGRPAGREAAHR